MSKTLAEKAAWDFAANEGLELVVLNPAWVLGPTLTPSISLSLHVLLHIMKGPPLTTSQSCTVTLIFSAEIGRFVICTGQRFDMDAFSLGSVDVRDVAQSLVVLYENPSAQGRHLCLESSQGMVDFINQLADLYPELPIKR